MWVPRRCRRAQESLLLRRLLTGGPVSRTTGTDLAAAFFAGLGPILETPWAMAAIPDFIFAQTTGERPADFDRMLKLGRALQRLAGREPAVHRLMVEVQHLLKPRSAYRRPLLLARLMLESLRR